MSLPAFEWTRWRELSNPVHSTDLLQADAPRYIDGHLPAGFVILLWDGKALRGPMQFKEQWEADDYLYSNTDVEAFLVVPKP